VLLHRTAHKTSQDLCSIKHGYVQGPNSLGVYDAAGIGRDSNHTAGLGSLQDLVEVGCRPTGVDGEVGTPGGQWGGEQNICTIKFIV